MGPRKQTPFPGSPRPKLLDQLRQALRSRHYSRRTGQTYCHWTKRFIFFHQVRHPAEMAEPEINAFLTHLAVQEKVSASTQNQALSALLFLYRHVIGREVGEPGETVDRPGFAALPMRFDREILMPIRIRRRDKIPHLTQQADVARVRRDPPPHSQACYTALQAGFGGVGRGGLNIVGHPVLTSNRMIITKENPQSRQRCFKLGMLLCAAACLALAFSGCMTQTSSSIPALIPASIQWSDGILGMKSPDWMRGYSVPPEQLRLIVLRTLQGDTLRLRVLNTVSPTIETDYETYPGQERGHGPGKKQWEERSRYFIKISSGAEQMVVSILTIHAETQERRGPGYVWQRARDSVLAEQHIQTILRYIGEEVGKVGGQTYGD